MIAVHWFRRDLRLHDNPALLSTAHGELPWVGLYVLDPCIISRPDTAPWRLEFLLRAIGSLGHDLARLGSQLVVRLGDARAVVPDFLRETGTRVLSFGLDPEPYSRARDRAVYKAARELGVEVRWDTEMVLVPPGTLKTGKGTPYTVFTPYKRAWLTHLDRTGLAAPLPAPAHGRLPGAVPGGVPLPTAAELGLPLPTPRPEPWPEPSEGAARAVLDSFVASRMATYHEHRDLPAVEGTARISPYLKFGMIGPRTLWRAARSLDGPGATMWQNELIWREFYKQILHEFPHVETHAFQRRYDGISWPGTDAHFDAWAEGRTGYPIVDAAMRQLRREGWMHNRLRMIAASFLVKDLQVDWRRGEQFFMRWLLDGDLSANNGGWQWSASTGTDAQPWFRIFNPLAQGRKFDPSGEFVRRHVPELSHLDARVIHAPWESGHAVRGYPTPVVDHAAARLVTLALFERQAPAGSSHSPADE